MKRGVALIGLLALLTVGVALGVHLMHKDALADPVIYDVYLWQAGQGALTDATVAFRFRNGNNWALWLPPSSQGGGVYKRTRDVWADEWQIRLDEWADPVYIGLEPWWGWFAYPSALENSVEWEVEVWER